MQHSSIMAPRRLIKHWSNAPDTLGKGYNVKGQCNFPNGNVLHLAATNSGWHDSAVSDYRMSNNSHWNFDEDVITMKLENPSKPYGNGRAFVMDFNVLYQFFLDRLDKVNVAKSLAEEVAERHNDQQGDQEEPSLRVTLESAVVEDVKKGDKPDRAKFLLMCSQWQKLYDTRAEKTACRMDSSEVSVQMKIFSEGFKDPKKGCNSGYKKLGISLPLDDFIYFMESKALTNFVKECEVQQKHLIDSEYARLREARLDIEEKMLEREVAKASPQPLKRAAKEMGGGGAGGKKKKTV